MITIVGIRYRNYTRYTLYRSCLPICRIAILRSQSFSFLDDFEGNPNISVAIKLGSPERRHNSDYSFQMLRYSPQCLLWIV